MAILNTRFVMAAAGAAALVAVWLSDPLQSPVDEVEEREELSTNEPDIEATQVEFNQLNPDGSLHYRLRAQRISQFESQQLTRMSEPDLHLTSAAQPPWDVQSANGYIRKQTGPAGQAEDVVYLRERVQMVQDHPTSGQITLRSEIFYIYPDRQFAETDQDVMIDTEVGRTKAAGMAADLQTGILKLSSKGQQRVHTIVLPEQFKNS